MKSELNVIIKELIGARSLSEVQASTGISKATASRLVRGNYLGRPSPKNLWKLTELDTAKQSSVTFETVMRVAGYTEAEISQHRKTFSAESAEFLSSECKILRVIRNRLSSKVSEYKEIMIPIAGGGHSVRFELKNTEMSQWTFVFPGEWSGGIEEAERLVGICALMPRQLKSKVSILYPTDILRRFAFKTSLANNVSVVVMTKSCEFLEEFYLNAVDGEIQNFL